MSEANIEIGVEIVDNVFVKMHRLVKAGTMLQGHSHPFDHITLLSSGSVRMEHDNGEQTFTAPHLIVTPKGVRHKFTALEDNTIFTCIHAVRDGTGVEDVAPPSINAEQAMTLLREFPLIDR